jgi:hypothetical protein
MNVPMGTDASGPEDDPWAALEAAAQAAEDKAAEGAGGIYPLTGRARASKRERIVLAKRRSNHRVLRTLAELADQTSVGEDLVRQLVRMQLMLSARFMLLTALVLVGIPLLFVRAPSLGTLTILGLRLPWLLLGFVVYPFFVAVAWSYNRSVDRNEQDFAEMAEN